MEILSEDSAARLPALVDRAAQALSTARTAAEVLEARDVASLAYDLAKKAARLAQAKGAHDSLIAAAHRVQADALMIEARAKRRLADEYDGAQERGEVQRHGDVPDGNIVPTAADLGLTRKMVYEARRIRDAEARDPGIVERTVAAALARGDEPTRAEVRRATTSSERMVAVIAPHERENIVQREFDALCKLWYSSCEDARHKFHKHIGAPPISVAYAVVRQPPKAPLVPTLCTVRVEQSEWPPAPTNP